jgi:hypothetical protein
VIVDQATLDQIGSRVRRRVLELPVRHGRLGELKRCPLRVGGKETLVPRIPYERYLDQVSKHPHRARAVVELTRLCEQPVKTQQITITSVDRAGAIWLVRFVKGDHPELFDRDVYLSRSNDFTMDASRQTVKGDPPLCTPFAEDLERAREKAIEKRVDPDLRVIRGVKDALSPLQQSLADMKARNRLRLILKQVELLNSELSVTAGATISVSDRAAVECSAAVEGAGRPRGTEPFVRLKPAA